MRTPTSPRNVLLRQSEDVPAAEPLMKKDFLELFQFHIRVMTQGILRAAHERGQEMNFDAAQLEAVTRFDGLPESEQLMILRAHKNDLDATED